MRFHVVYRQSVPHRVRTPGRGSRSRRLRVGLRLFGGSHHGHSSWNSASLVVETECACGSGVAMSRRVAQAKQLSIVRLSLFFRTALAFNVLLCTLHFAEKVCFQ